MAIILLLALALARPELQGTGWVGDQEAPVAVAMVFDTQPRMEYRYQNQTRLEAARETAVWLLVAVAARQRRGGDRRPLRIERVRGRSGGGPAADRAADHQRRRHAVGQIARTMRCDCSRRAPAQRKEIYVFTDLARSAWSGAASAVARPSSFKHIRKSVGT